MTLFEKASNLSGRAATQNHEGYRFNRGIHAIYTGGAVEEVLQELGIPYNGHSPKEVFILRQSKLHNAPYGPLTLLQSKLFGVADKLEFMRVFTALPRLNPHELAAVSVQEWPEHNLRRPGVRQFMAAFTRTYVAAGD